MQLSCPSCEKPVKSDDINLNKLIAKCSYCHAVFRFSENEIAAPTPNQTHQEQTKEEPAEGERRGRRKGPAYRPQRPVPPHPRHT